MLPNPLLSVKSSFQELSAGARASRRLLTFGGIRTVTWVAVGLLLVALVYLAQFSNAALLARSLQVKESKIAELREANDQFRYDIAAATAPATIEARARKAGLGPAKNIVYADVPALRPDRAAGIPALDSQLASVSAPLKVPAAASPWNQVLSLFGLDHGSIRVQAESK